MNAPLSPDAFAPAARPMATIELDGRVVDALPGETLIECADRHGVEIPRLCYKPGYRPDGNCRACMVEIDGERVLAASCCRQATEGMRVSTQSERARASQRMVLELLRADMPAQETKPYSARSELDDWCAKLDVPAARFPERAQPRPDLSHGLMAVNLDACIQCTRCVRACREEQVNDVIGLAFRGEHTKVVFDLDEPMGDSSCVSCGECVQACPTGALAYANDISRIVPDRQVDTVCGYCGVGCAITLNIKDEKIVSVDGRDAEANHGRLCVKGRFGIPQLVHNPTRLTTPLARACGDRRNPLVPVSWDEAFDLIAAKLKPFVATDEFAIIGCSESTNEEQYLTSKFGRAGMKTNNVSSVAHLCHANTVRGLIPLFGSGAQSLPHDQISEAKCLLVIGNNPAETHPVVGNEIKQAAKKGAKVIVANPRRTALHRFATHVLDLKPGTDVPLVMAMCRVIVEENLYDAQYVASRTVGFEAFLENVREYDIDQAARASGVPREAIVAAARTFATQRPGVALWGMGIAQHSHGSQNVWALGNLCLLTGNMGVHAGGIAPLRGHSNVMGATDMSLTTAWYPGYQMCPGYETIPGLAQFPNMHEKFEKGWNTWLPTRRGLTMSEVFRSAAHVAPPRPLAGSDPDRVIEDAWRSAGLQRIRALYLIGSDAASTVAEGEVTRQAFEKLEFVVVQDLFLNETAKLADVVLPASCFAEKDGTFTSSERRVQLLRKAVEPPGEARADWEILCEVAKRLGFDGFDFASPARIMEEIAALTPTYGGIRHERLGADGIQWPCYDTDHPGTPVLHEGKFYRVEKARFQKLYHHPELREDDEFPLTMVTGRSLYHWHTTTSGRVDNLDRIVTDDYVLVNPMDAETLGLVEGTEVEIRSRHGAVRTRAHVSDEVPVGVVFKTFHFAHSPTNRLATSAEIDPVGTTPNTKLFQVRVEKVGEAMAH